MAQEKVKFPPETLVEFFEETNPKYSNRVQLFVSSNDVMMDFILMEPPVPGAKSKTMLQARIVTTLQHAKQFSAILAQNIEKYEKDFGLINIEPKKK